MKYLPLLIFLLALPLRAQMSNLEDDAAFEAWKAGVEAESALGEPEEPGRNSEGTQGSTLLGTPVERCSFEVRLPNGDTDHTALYKNCVCECLTSDTKDPREILECAEQCVVPGTFEGDEYKPADEAVVDLWEAGDFKSFYDFSLKGNGGAFGVAYELTDGMARTPWGPRYKFRDGDDKTGQCPAGWDKIEEGAYQGRCRRERRINLTSEAAVSEHAVGFHLGLKFIPVFDAGFFVGGKWNFKADEFDTTLGIEWIKLDF